MSRHFDDSRERSNKEFNEQLITDNAIEKEAKRNEGLPPDTYFFDKVLLPVKIIPIANTENCCRRCRGLGETCDDGGAFIYCDILNHYAMQDSGLDVSGDSNVGCNNFRPTLEAIQKDEEKQLLDSVHALCTESLPPDYFEKWEDVKSMLVSNRNIRALNVEINNVKPPNDMQCGVGKNNI